MSEVRLGSSDEFLSITGHPQHSAPQFAVVRLRLDGMTRPPNSGRTTPPWLGLALSIIGASAFLMSLLGVYIPWMIVHAVL